VCVNDLVSTLARAAGTARSAITTCYTCYCQYNAPGLLSHLFSPLIFSFLVSSSTYFLDHLVCCPILDNPISCELAKLLLGIESNLKHLFLFDSHFILIAVIQNRQNSFTIPRARYHRSFPCNCSIQFL